MSQLTWLSSAAFGPPCSPRLHQSGDPASQSQCRARRNMYPTRRVWKPGVAKMLAIANKAEHRGLLATLRLGDGSLREAESGQSGN
eukprot:63368-Rhodomonas_salina.1